MTMIKYRQSLFCFKMKRVCVCGFYSSHERKIKLYVCYMA